MVLWSPPLQMVVLLAHGIHTTMSSSLSICLIHLLNALHSPIHTVKRPMGYYAYFVAHNSRTSTCDPITEALEWVAWIETNTQVWNSFFSILLSILIVMLYSFISGINLCNAEGLCCVALPSVEKNDWWYRQNHMWNHRKSPQYEYPGLTSKYIGFFVLSLIHVCFHFRCLGNFWWHTASSSLPCMGAVIPVCHSLNAFF